jgi:hypothetical protein
VNESLKYSGTSVHEQIFGTKRSLVTNGVSSNEHASRKQRLATRWEYRWEIVNYCVTFAQYTSLLEFAVLSLEETVKRKRRNPRKTVT